MLRLSAKNRKKCEGKFTSTSTRSRRQTGNCGSHRGRRRGREGGGKEPTADAPASAVRSPAEPWQRCVPCLLPPAVCHQSPSLILNSRPNHINSNGPRRQLVHQLFFLSFLLPSQSLPPCFPPPLPPSPSPVQLTPCQYSSSRSTYQQSAQALPPRHQGTPARSTLAT